MAKPPIHHAAPPPIRQLLASGRRMSERQEMGEYKKMVQQISPLVGNAGVSIEVFSDQKTTSQEMLRQASS